MTYKTIEPGKIPSTSQDWEKHRNNPSLVRDFVLNLPDGFSLYYFCRTILGYDDLDPRIHGPLCYFLEHSKYGRFRDATVPRSWFKTSIATIGKSIWLPIRRDPNIRILIAMNTAENAEKRIFTIKKQWETNTLLQEAFPELVPDFKGVRWSNHCAELKRERNREEGTYESIGAGGAVVSRHYDHIIEDDLVYAKKDDLHGTEIQPNQEDIDKAIGWHKLSYSLFSHPAQSTLDNIGTRWAPHDLKDWIYTHEKSEFKFFRVNAEKQDGEGNFTGEPVWKNRFSRQVLDDILVRQGPYMYYTQYLNCPRDPADALFELQWIKYYEKESDILQPCSNATFVDLALWGDTKGKARNIVLTLSRDNENNLWIRRYDRGKFNPTQVIDLMEAHNRAYKSDVYVEEVYYQKAIRHFAKKRMHDTGNFYIIRALPKSTGKDAKSTRIKTVQPVAFHGALHIKPGMSDLKRELADYPNGLTCDIIDTIGYATQFNLPFKPDKQEKKVETSPFLLENVLSEISRNHSSGLRYPFEMQLGKKNAN